MGRGRQKAKHTKVARDLKYFSPATDYEALARELSTHELPEDDDLQKWPEYSAAKGDDDDDPGDAAAGGHTPEDPGKTS